jgi:hypothetical protein
VVSKQSLALKLVTSHRLPFRIIHLTPSECTALP